MGGSRHESWRPPGRGVVLPDDEEPHIHTPDLAGGQRALLRSLRPFPWSGYAARAGEGLA